MAHVILETVVRAPIEVVFDCARDVDLHQRSLAATRERATGGTTRGLIGIGETVTWKARHLGVTWTLTARVTQFDPPRRFVDEQLRGPFRSFRHEHRFAETAGGTLMTDDWQHVAPLALLGRIADRLLLRRHIAGVLATRARAIADEAESRATGGLSLNG